MACNERCPFCNVPFEDYAVRTPPLDEVRAELQEIIAAGEKTLTVSGGEPTLYRDRLLAIASEARQGGIDHVEVQTNATLIDGDYARDMAEAGVTSAFVSFLSHIEELHDTLAGLEGAFEPCLLGIDAMQEAGIPVTLNPVVARATQTLIADYVDFVAARLPAVRHISLSAVQPHGRAARNLELLPDYALFAPEIERARERAQIHGIELLNPYCGVPVCVGWSDELESCVEAFEARRGGFDTPGLQNLGNKSHGHPCRRCAMRTRCGGAWHAYWKVRGGSGLRAPAEIVLPWHPDASASPHQMIAIARGGPDPNTWNQLRQSESPIAWVWTDRLHPEHVNPLLSSRCTDIAIELDPHRLEEQKETLRGIRALTRAVAGWQPQRRIKVWLGFPAETAPILETIDRAAALAEGLDAAGIRLLGTAEPAASKRVATLRARHTGLDIAPIKSFFSVHSSQPEAAEGPGA